MALASVPVKVWEFPGGFEKDGSLVDCAEYASALKVRKAAVRPVDTVRGQHPERESDVSEEATGEPARSWLEEHPGSDLDGRILESLVAKVSDHLEKRQRRAERFGINLQVSEAERRIIRSVRFGPVTDTWSRSKPRPLSLVEEAAKRTARSVRFGSAQREQTSSSKYSTIESKKRVRAARFGIPENPGSEERKRARTARFG